MALTATFDPVLSRVRLAGTGLTTGTTALFEHSSNQVMWTTVRGGSAVTISPSDTASLDDYEFNPGVINYYRVKDTTHTFTANVTPVQAGVWLKSLSRPFLNRMVNVIDHTDISRPAKNGIFEIMGNSFPIAVTDLRSSRRWTFTIQSEDVAEADAVDLVFASGDPLFIQTDGENDIPSGYVIAGDVSRSRYGHQSVRRWLDVPVTEVSAPGPDVYGTPSTWATLVAEFADWSAVGTEFSTWTEVTEYIADPSTVIVT